MLRRGWLLAGVLMALGMNSAWAGDEPLRVLLTTDDGFEAIGLKAVRVALEQAGYAVSMVAPLTQQSGSGVRITLGEYARRLIAGRPFGGAGDRTIGRTGQAWPLTAAGHGAQYQCGARAAGDIKGVRLAPLSRHGGFHLIYPQRPVAWPTLTSHQ